VGDAPRESHLTSDYEDELRRLADCSELRGRVTFLGFQSDIRPILAAADVLVVPSYEEPFGIVILEAMAVGTPVVAVAAGGPLDVIEDGKTGLLVPAGDISALARAIERLSNDTLLRNAMVAAASRHVRIEFSFDSLSTHLQSFYVGLLGTAPDEQARAQEA